MNNSIYYTKYNSYTKNCTIAIIIQYAVNINILFNRENNKIKEFNLINLSAYAIILFISRYNLDFYYVLHIYS
jgi:hypothetical protein